MTTSLKPRFGIDIDGTVTCPSTLIPHINKQYNLSITINDVVEYDFLSAFPSPVDRTQFQRWFKENEPEMYRLSELAQGAKETLQSWRNQFELFYISARDAHVYDITKNWFELNQIPYDHIELIGNHNKLEVAKMHQVEVFFEDKHDNAVMLAEELNIPVILFDTPYNRLQIPNNVIRVSNWQEANTWIQNNF